MAVWNPFKKEYWTKDNLMNRDKLDKMEQKKAEIGDGWEHCPRCGSNRVEQRGKLFWFFVMFGSGGCLIWVGIIFFPVLIIAIPLILFSPVAFIIPKTNQCKDCNYAWAVAKKSKNRTDKTEP